MQIQQSHFFTNDLFVNLLAFLAIYLAVAIADVRGPSAETAAATIELQDVQFTTLQLLLSNRLLLLSLGFGLAYGMALASKVNIYPLAVLLPGAFVIRYLISDRKTLAVDEPEQIAAPLSTGDVQSQ